MANKAYHKPISMFWTLGVPAVLFGVIWYAYNSTGWVSSQVQRTLGPILAPIIRWADRLI
ncbi:MAG: hypothetical protein R2724_17070 [Bryobacterales bacterium]